MQIFKKILLVSIIVVAPFSINAKSYNWDNITQQQYVDNLVSCETQLQEYKWSKNLWPKQNKKPKPAFSEVLDIDKTYEKVIANLKMQSVLANYFNTTITNKLLQHDLDRMVGNTKDAKGLEQMFALFDNDAATVVQCISRPYLVRQKIESNYKYNSEIHALVKTQAQSELQSYLDSINHMSEFKATVSTVTYKIKQENGKRLNQNLSEELIIELESKEFKQKSQELTNNNLQEKNHSFIFTEILQKSKESVKVKILSWAKQSINLWLQGQPNEIYAHKSNNTPFKLSKIPGDNNNLSEIKAGVVGNTWPSTSIGVNVPSGRKNHTAIWSGSEMIVWGGYDLGYLNTGGLYNPSTDSWSSTSIGASGRYSHTAIWNGSEMIVWGGFNNINGRLNTGGRYNPNTDSWSSTSIGTNVPRGRTNHTAIWSGSEMIVWGGFSNYLNTGGRYDPSTDSWVPTSIGANVPSGRSGHTAIWSGTEMIVWGGSSYDYSQNISIYYNTGGRYDPNTDSWKSTSIGTDVPSGRSVQTAVWSGNEMIVWGGFDGSNNINTGGRYNPDTDIWSSTSTVNVPRARGNHTAIWSGTEMIVWGGSYYDRAQNIAIYKNTGGRYDPSTDSWTSTGICANARSQHTAIWSGTEMIIWGGYDYDVEQYINTGGLYDPTLVYNSTCTISGNLTGLNGNQVTIQNNGGDNLTLTANGSFSFVNALVEGSNYEVTVLTNPLSPAQTCLVINGSGMNIIENVTDVAINCGNDFFNVGVTVSGLTAGNSVFVKNNAIDLTEISDNDVLTYFTTQVGNGLDYIITFDTQPTNPKQTCSITLGEETGTVSSADVNVAVSCVTDKFDIAVTVAGLDSNNSIELTTNSQSLMFNTNTTKNFVNSINDGTAYAVLLTANPMSPNQTCTITGGNGGSNDGSGTLVGGDVAIAVNCVTDKFDIGVTVSGLDANNSIELTTNSQSLTFNSNTTLNFTNPINDGTAYAVLLTAQPTDPVQTCTITGGNNGNDDGAGTLSGSDAGISVYCNTPLITVANTYTVFEDIIMLANDADGSVTGVNNDGVLVNDSDVDGDTLMVVNAGTYTAVGLGGQIALNADGTFVYVPPADVSGQDVLSFDVTDGVHTVGSSLTIDVLPVNDAPTFSILGNILSAELHPDIVNTTLTIPMFAFDIYAGADDESSQSLQFAPIILADSNSVLVANGISVNNAGELSLNFTGNIGLAIIRLILLDDGPTTNGGDNTSVITEFVVSYSDLLFVDSFEEPQINKLFNFLDGIKSKSPLKNYPIYDLSNNSLVYYEHQLKLDGAYMTPQVIKQWVTEVEMLETKNQ